MTEGEQVGELEGDGFAIHRGVIGGEELAALVGEASRLAHERGTACVRDVERDSPMIASFAVSPELCALLPEGLSPVRVILFDKTPKENWPVGWHQDLSIAVAGRVEVAGYSAWTVKNGVPHVQPPLGVMEAMATIRLHLDDTSAANGALKVVPGSHRLGRIPSERVMPEVKKGQVVCECAAGDVLLMKPLLLHASSRSQAASHRRVIHIEYAAREVLDERLAWHLAAMPCEL